MPTPTKEGYEFLGWTLEKGSKDYITKISNKAQGEINIYANWKIKNTTLDEAINAANDGDTIILGEGEFTLSVAINKSITIQGAGSSKTIINVKKDLGANVNADEVVIDSVTLKGTGGGTGIGGVYFQDGANMRSFTVKNSVITSMNTFLKISGKANNIAITLENNSFDTMGQFLIWVLDGLDKLTFEGNTVDSSSCGAVVNFAAALLRIRAGSAYISNNTFIGDTQETAALFECGLNATEMKIENNVFNNVSKYVYINGGKPVVFGENTYTDAEGNVLSAVPETVTGNGVTPGTAKTE